jgi:hypothetical protein
MEYPAHTSEWDINHEFSRRAKYWKGDVFEDRAGDLWRVDDVVYSVERKEIEYIISCGPGGREKPVGKRHLDDLEQVEEGSRPKPKISEDTGPEWAEGVPYWKEPEELFKYHNTVERDDA